MRRVPGLELGSRWFKSNHPDHLLMKEVIKMPAGARRNGRPRTEAERKARHKRLHGKNAKVPPRGTGLKRKK